MRPPPRSRAPAPRCFQLVWTAPGDDGAAGTPAEYDLRVSFTPLTAQNAASAPRSEVAIVPLSGGQGMAADLAGLFSGVKYYATLRAIDDAGQAGRFSNIVSVQLRDRQSIWEPPRVLSTLTSTDDVIWRALTVGADGTLLVAGTLEEVLRRYSPAEAVLPTWPVGAPLRDVARFKDGRVALLVQTPPCVRLLDGQGTPMAAWGDYGAGAGRFCAPRR